MNASKPTVQQIEGARVIELLSTRTRCMFCKHRFPEPLLLPVKKPERGKLQPNFSVDWLHHVADTHGYPVAIFCGWVTQAIYTPQSQWELIAYNELFEPIEDAYQSAKAALRERSKR